MTDFATLPADLGRSRILDSKSAANFVGLSLPHFRRQYRSGAVPAPIRIGERKYGWRAGDLVDWLASRVKQAA